jgi:putative transposase
VWLYYRFCLSSRDVEELLFVRGIIVTYEAIRQRVQGWLPKGSINPKLLRSRPSIPSRRDQPE